MTGYMSLEEQVDKDFSLARRKALLGRSGARLQRDNASDGLPCFDDVRTAPGAVGRVYRGIRTVPGGQIWGNVGRCSEFDRDFLPAKASMQERWKHVDRAFRWGEVLPSVSRYKIGGFYFVLDGHYRVSVAHYLRVEWIDAEVTEVPAGSWRDQSDRDDLIEPSEGGEPILYEAMGSNKNERLLEEAMLSQSPTDAA
jgi:hypothetical protein